MTAALCHTSGLPDPRLGHVLIVDDDPLIRRLLERLLKRYHRITLASCGAEAMDLLDGGERFDVIISDLHMPEMSGMELHERLLHDHPMQAERMVFISGGAYSDRAERFVRSMPNRCIDKTMPTRALRAFVRECVEQVRGAA